MSRPRLPRRPLHAEAQRVPRGRRAGRGDLAPEGLGGAQVEGRRAVHELLATRRREVQRVWMAQDLPPSPLLDKIEALARSRKVRVEHVPAGRLRRVARTESPQGVVAWARPLEAVRLEDLCEPREGATGGAPFLLVTAGLTDPHNLGSLLRSFECAGATGVVLARHRAAHVTPTVTKVAAGAVEHMRFSVVPGIPAALLTLSRLGVWTVGLAAEASRRLEALRIADAPVALVVGNEDRGLPRLVRARCDEIVAIAQHGAIPSLNVAAAGAVAAFEVARQRASAAGGPLAPKRTATLPTGSDWRPSGPPGRQPSERRGPEPRRRAARRR